MTQGFTSGEALSVHHLTSDHLADQGVRSETVDNHEIIRKINII